MKALTLSQPWATLIATGDKKIETRDWPTNYRGPLAIHAAKGFPPDAKALCEHPAVRTMLTRAGDGAWPPMLHFGVILATCQLVGCIPTDRIDWARINSKERILGAFGPNRFAFLLQDIQALKAPIPARGQLGLWEWDASAAGVDPLVTGRLF